MSKKPSVALKLCEITKVYGQGDTAVEALKKVDLTFRKNEFVSILGPSGCGKTTLLNIVGGLDRYTAGDLVIDGISTKQYKDGDWDTYRNNRIGFVFQNYNLISHQTVLSNVELALTLSGVSKAERQKRALKVLEEVGLKDQAKKLPGQMSGGQMQRVAIARALVNDPDIILADEPTGALDTETSIQIMELLKEVAKDRLVIMVTHNPQLAEKYSTRIINLLDGEVIGDTNPCVEQVDDEQISLESKQEKKSKKKSRSAMKFATALALSLSNLRAKKARTILTSIAGSIGIIGIALVLAVSTGFSAYVDKLQADTLSVYPVTVAESAIDVSDFEKLLDNTVSDEMLNQKLKQEVYTSDMFNSLTNMLKSNLLEKNYAKQEGQTYLEYTQKFVNEKNASLSEDEWKYCIQKAYSMDVNNFIFSEMRYNVGEVGAPIQKQVMSIDTLVGLFENMFAEGIAGTGIGMGADMIRSYIPTITEIPNNINLVKSQYELIDDGGRFPQNKNELLFVVDEYNRINDITLALLGIGSIDGISQANGSISVVFEDKQSWTFDELKAKEFYYINNTDRYEDFGNGNFGDKMFTLIDEKVNEPMGVFAVPESAKQEPMKIVGVVRLKDGVKQGVLKTGIAYTEEFTNYILSDEKNISSPIGIAVNSQENTSKTVNVATSFNYTSYKMTNGMLPLKTTPMNARSLAVNDAITKLSIFSIDYEAKEQLKDHLDKWNEVIDEDDQEDVIYKVHYSDSTEMLFMALNSIVDAVKIALVCFTSISLVVSSIMIGIITYVSVVERTKEIGILRSMGARKKDISRIFNAETFLIGLFAGIFGIAVTYLLSIPINLIVGGLIEGIGQIAALKFSSACILVVVSFILTLISGIIPSRIAAKKDPVVALRNE